MLYKKNTTLIAVLLIAALSGGSTPALAGTFEIFDGTLYVEKPDLSVYGLKPARILYSIRFWPDGNNMDKLPVKDKILRLAKDAERGRALTILDVEHWPLNRVPSDQVNSSLSKYLTFLKWFREGAPTTKIGYYGLIPIGDYSRAIRGPGDSRHADWAKENDRIRDLADQVDMLCPSLYTAKSDPQGWAKVAIENIKEARRLGNGKPVYVFLWPLYDDNLATDRNMVHTYIGTKFWTLQLETAMAHADGVIIWGGWDFSRGRPAQWDDSAQWWQDTKLFLSQLKASKY